MFVKKASYVTGRPLKELIILRYKKQNFLNNLRPRAEEYETIGFIFWHDFRNRILFVEMKVGSVNICFFDMFSDFECQFFSISGEHFCERAVKNVIFVSRRLFWRDDKIWELVFLVSEFDRENFWLLAENFCMFLKTEVQVTTGFFRGKECINENFNTWFFPEFERKTAPISVNFFWRSVKRQSMTAEELL